MTFKENLAYPSYWLIAVADPSERPVGPGAPSLFLHQIEARRDEKNFFWRPPLSQGLHPALLNYSLFGLYKNLKVSKFWREILLIIYTVIPTYFVVDLSL